ncbi:MAG: type II toxin-antitoxin system VapC family toxin [Gemmatimonadetes bacterium]|nr:type II toxin-antitoxin system VapC family toxin [Gemmatimonadota bacterium]
MRALLDTHTLLWMLSAPEQLSPRARRTIEDARTSLVVSVASAWEVAIKVGRGSLRLNVTLADLFSTHLARARVDLMEVKLSHTLEVAALPPLHRDPFDRLLVATSSLEDLPILSADAMFDRYGVERIW